MKRLPVLPVLAMALALLAAGFAARPAAAQRDWSQAVIQPQELAGGLWMLSGVGGNLLLCTGADGALLVDAQYAPLAGRIRAAVDSLGRGATGGAADPPLRFVVNTHYHGDHVGGDSAMAAGGAAIVAHENVRARMMAPRVNAATGDTTPATPRRGWPVLTFTDSVTFHLNGHELRVVHLPPGHTDGDAYVWVPDTDVLHAGDLLFNGTYPVIDVAAGGSIGGMIRSAEALLAVVGPATRVVPGHGPLADREALRRFRDMLVTVRDRVTPLVERGMTLEQIVAAKPLADLDETWGKGFMRTDRFLAAVHSDLVRTRAPGGTTR